MNLELLGASKDQLPDRIDATLGIPIQLYQPAPTKKRKSKGSSAISGQGSKLSASCISYNRRGNYVAVAYSDGSVAVFDILSRSICAMYKTEKKGDTSSTSSGTTVSNATRTFLSWSRRSRSLLAGSSGDKKVRLIDTTHPYGPEECVVEKKDDKEKAEDDGRQSPFGHLGENKKQLELQALFSNSAGIKHVNTPRFVQMKQIDSSKDLMIPTGRKSTLSVAHVPTQAASTPRYPMLLFEFPHPVSGSLQIHPVDTCSGMAILEDGSLIAFQLPVNAWEVNKGGNDPIFGKFGTIHKSDEFSFTSASFDRYGDKIYAATSYGDLVGFDVGEMYDSLSNATEEAQLSPLKPGFSIQIPGGSAVFEVVVNRKGDALILNSEDGMIRLYSTKECWSTPENVDKPDWVLQGHGSTSAAHFVTCDFSGDGKFILAALTGEKGNYELFIWSATTGKLLDTLTGASSNVNCARWHPVRSFVAVAAADGLVDLWGPRVNWTAFAPSFEALTENIEYVECEDEFDIFQNQEMKVSATEDVGIDGENPIDVLQVDAVATFASDSEGEDAIFTFETKVKQKVALNSNGGKDA